MLKFTKPVKLNGEQLINELNAAGVKITEIPFLDGNGDLWLDVAEKDKEKAESIVAAHVGIDQELQKQAARAEILNRLGLTADEAAILLG
jgi:hypothetical protein